MIIKKYDNNEEWMEDRRTKIGGSRLGDLVVLRGDGEKKAFYELIAERLAKPASGENVMDRGHRLEVEAIEILESILNKEFNKDLVIWSREDNESISVSPDGYHKSLKEAVEVKCLCSADHLKALIENQYPKDYKWQVLQYFIVNDKLETLYFTMYDDRLMFKQFHYFTIKREDLKEDIEKYREYEIEKLEKINNIVESLSF